MFKFASQNFIFLVAIIICGHFDLAWAHFQNGHEAQITSISAYNELKAISDNSDWVTFEKLAIVSSKSELGVIAFAELLEIKPIGQKFELKLKLVRQSRQYMTLVGDKIKKLDLTGRNSDYLGGTELVIQDADKNVASRYRALVHQGFVIGDTAQTLYKNEFLMNYFGNLYYGLNNWLTLGTLLPVNAFGRPNANFRARFYNSDSTTLSSGLSFVRLVKEDEASLNLNLYWDSISSDSLISHTFLSFGLVNWKNSGDAAAIKYLTSSSFQTGYEMILDDWNRFLIGPSYNFDKKALGGYLSYIWIEDRTHIQLSLNATDVTHLRFDPTDGYYAFFDLFWRF